MGIRVVIAGILSIMSLTFFLPSNVYATDCGGKTLGAGQSCCGGVVTNVISCKEGGGSSILDSGIWGMLIVILNIFTTGVGIAAVGGIIYGAVIYTSSSGNIEQSKKAKKIIGNTVVGVVMYALLYSSLNFLIPGGVFGVNPPPVSSVADSSAPSAPTSLYFEEFVGYLKLTWSASKDNVGVKGYIIERRPGASTGSPTEEGWEQIGSVASTSTLEFTDIIASGGLDYSYRIIAFDEAGNESPPSYATEFLPTSSPITIRDGGVSVGSDGSIDGPVAGLKEKSIEVLIIGNQFKFDEIFNEKVNLVKNSITSIEPYRSNSKIFEFFSEKYSNNKLNCSIKDPERSTSGPSLNCDIQSILDIRARYNADIAIVVDDQLAYYSPGELPVGSGSGYPGAGIAIVTSFVTVYNSTSRHDPLDSYDKNAMQAKDFTSVVLHEFSHALGLNDEYNYFGSANGPVSNNFPKTAGKFGNATCFAGVKTGWAQGCFYQNWYREKASNLMYNSWQSLTLAPMQKNMLIERFKYYSDNDIKYL